MKQDENLRLIAVQLPLLYDREQISDGLLALSRQLKVNKFNLLRTSIGGYIAQWFTYSHPESVARLYICNSVILMAIILTILLICLASTFRQGSQRI